MSIPKYNELYRPLLEYIRDGQARTTAELEEALARQFSLTDADRQERLSSGSLTFCNRIAWARTYLKKAGLVTSPKRGTVQITPEGKNAVDKPGLRIDNDFLATFPSFAEFQKGGQTATTAENRPSSLAEDEDSPQDSLDRAYTRIRQTLAEDVLTEIMRQTPAFFEQLVVRLLEVMEADGDSTGIEGSDSGRPEDAELIQPASSSVKDAVNAIAHPEESETARIGPGGSSPEMAVRMVPTMPERLRIGPGGSTLKDTMDLMDAIALERPLCDNGSYAQWFRSLDRKQYKGKTYLQDDGGIVLIQAGDGGE